MEKEETLIWVGKAKNKYDGPVSVYKVSYGAGYSICQSQYGVTYSIDISREELIDIVNAITKQ